MPLNIVIGLVALLVALVLYSLAAWGSFRAKSFQRRHLTLVWVGLGFDVLATAMMAIAAGGLDLSPFADMMHTIVALVAMFAMLFVAVVGGQALSAAKETTLRALSTWMLAPWALWVFVFIWGMLSRGSQRMG